MSTRKMAKLEFLSGQFETMDDFALLYETMLEEAKATEDKDRRQARARALQKIMMKQTEFLMNAWIAEKKAMPLYVKRYGFGALN